MSTKPEEAYKRPVNARDLELARRDIREYRYVAERAWRDAQEHYSPPITPNDYMLISSDVSTRRRMALRAAAKLGWLDGFEAVGPDGNRLVVRVATDKRGLVVHYHDGTSEPLSKMKIDPTPGAGRIDNAVISHLEGRAAS